MSMRSRSALTGASTDSTPSAPSSASLAMSAQRPSMNSIQWNGSTLHVVPECVNRDSQGSHYNILLKDFAYFQFTWESKSAWRLAYFPNPWITGVVNAEEKLVEWEGLTELGLLANDDVDEFVAELPYLGSVPPVRFEFSLIQYREVSHPAAMSLSLLKFVGQASLVDDAMLPS